MRRFECVEGKSSKFWEVRVSRSTVTVCYGRIGGEGTGKETWYRTPAIAQLVADKLVREKLRKGYVEVDAATARAAARKAAAAAGKKTRGVDQSAGLWAWLDLLRERGADPDRPGPYRARLATLLGELGDAALGRLLGELHAANAALHSRGHWLAASLLVGGQCTHEEFEDWRAWVIGHGRDAFERVRAQPDAVADLAVPGGDQPEPFLRPLAGGPAKACDKRKRQGVICKAMEHWAADVPDGALDYLGWHYFAAPTIAELERLFPRTWKAHGARWDASRRAFAADDRFVTSAQVPGLGEVRIGDTLLARHGGERLEILGLIDDRSLGVTARVREEDGEVSCNQGLGREYQRWPHEPVSVFDGLDDDEYEDAEDEDDDEAEFQARAEAIQQRVRKAIGRGARVVYSAYVEDDAGLPRDNLDDIAYRGAIRFVAVDAADGARFESDVLTDPTWLEVARVADKMIRTFGAGDHRFLEGLRTKKGARGAPAVGTLVMGS
jgi:predicted DNA-binding WGR domain protein